MSEFVNRSKITALVRDNAKLSTEIEDLKTELQKLNKRLEDPEGGNSGETARLMAQLAAYEQQAERLKILSQSVADSSKNRHETLGQLLAALAIEKPEAIIAALNQEPQKKRSVDGLVLFLLGILVASAVWYAVNHLQA